MLKPITANYEKISPTAKLVAYWRQFSDIPFSKDVASLFNVEDSYKIMFKDKDDYLSHNEILIPYFEIRYKCILHMLIKNNIKQVLEFASGISLRGLFMTEDPNLTYVETDLPTLTEEKVKLIKIIMDKYKIKNRAKLFFHSTNILNYNEIEQVLTHFDQSKPLAIVHEGLFQYLTKGEKAIAAKNIYKILKQFGGMWLTPDLDTESSLRRHGFSEQQQQKFMATIEKTTGRNFERNAFKDEEELIGFFNDLGFNVGFKPQMDKSIRLSSLENKQLPSEAIQTLDNLRLWIITVKA